MKSEYVNGIKEGIFTEYFEKGNKMFESNYEKGTLNGMHTEWYENGNKKMEINYYYLAIFMVKMGSACLSAILPVNFLRIYI